MEINEKIKLDELDNSLKNVILIIIIIIFAYIVERKFPESFIKNIFFLLVIIILILFAIKYFYKNLFNKISFFIKSILKNFSFFSDILNEEKTEEEKTEKIKNIYEYGYLNSMKKKNKNSFYENNEKYDSFHFNNDYNIKNDEFLDNKISNINKINKPLSMNTSFKKRNYYDESNYNKNYKNYNSNEYNYTKNSLTELQNSNENKANNNILGNIGFVSNPFKNKNNIPNSDDFSFKKYFVSKIEGTERKLNFDIDSNITRQGNTFSYLNNKQNKNAFFGKKIQNNKEISSREYQSLINKIENTQTLCQHYRTIDYNKNKNKIPKELFVVDYNKWMINMRIFISKNLIPNIITKHDNNISILNTFLYYFDLKIINTLPENDDEYLDSLNEKLNYLNSNKINEIKQDNDIFYQYIKTNNINNYNYLNNLNKENKENMFPSLKNFYFEYNDKKEVNNINDEKKLKYIFFGDTKKIKEILYLVEKKINELELQKVNGKKINPILIRQEIINSINYNKNPFLKKNYTKAIDDYLRKINDNNLTLTNLQRLLYERIILNERLYPKELFNKTSETHGLLVIEYAIERLRELQKNFSDYGNGSKGGDFLYEKWCSLLPTDSQLIAHLIINYIESIYLIKNKNNQQNFLISFPMSYIFPINESNSYIQNTTSIYLYQINPSDTEPKFNVVYNNILIPCLLDEMNLFHAFCIYFYLLNIKSRMFVMALGIHDFIDSLIDIN